MSGMKPTGEQEAIRDAYLTGENLAVTAGAGTGKTSTLVLLGHARKTRVRYIAYNNAIAREAGGRFPFYVKCSTSHSLAFQAVGYQYKHRLSNKTYIPGREVARILSITEPVLLPDLKLTPVQIARLALETVKRYCYSADLEISGRHVPVQQGAESAKVLAVLADLLPPLARRAWADIASIDGRLKFEHDHYVKLWQLSDPVITGDVLFLDESQDCNPVLEAIITRQRNMQIVAVGDSCQAIYGWRGAVDALDRLGGGNKLALSQSFRFGPAIAYEANKWLNLLDAELRLTGYEAIPSRLGPVDLPDAILSRSNAGVIKQVLAQLDAGRKVAIPSPKPGVPGGAEIGRLAWAAIDLKQGRGTDHPELLAFASWGQVRDYAENDPGGEDLLVLVDLIDDHTPEKILSMTSRLVETRYADVVVSTAHKAKGLEWNSVRITDFRKPKEDDSGEAPLPSREQMMLAYVAVTRAKHVLNRGSLAFVDDYLMAGAGAR